MRANQSVASNGLADLDFSLSTESMPVSNPSEADFTAAPNISTFHDPLLDEFRHRYVEEFYKLLIKNVDLKRMK